MVIRFFDMFAGIGGFRSGLENIGGFDCIGHCEIDNYANQAYSAIYDTRGEYFCEDARAIDPNDVPKFDLICAGFPCQSFSVAGKRRGFKDTRGTLFFEVARMLKSQRPAFFLLENVPGLLSHDNGKTLETIFSTLISLGYHFEWCVHNSKYFGVPQQRKRLYIVGYLRKECAGQVFPLPYCTSENLRQIIGGPQGQRVYDPEGVACTQAATSGGWGGKTGLYFIDLNSSPCITDAARCITARQDAGIGTHAGERSGVLLEDAISEECIPYITAKDKNGNIHRGRVRKLMPIECWRLQGFTDKQFYTAQATGLSDAQLYKMAGNSVSVPVITAIGERIANVCEKYHILEEES